MTPYGITAHYTQEVDSCGPSGGGYNLLDIEVTNAGGGPYIIIKTDRWALDVDDMEALSKEIRRLINEVEQ